MRQLHKILLRDWDLPPVIFALRPMFLQDMANTGRIQNVFVTRNVYACVRLNCLIR